MLLLSWSVQADFLFYYSQYYSLCLSVYFQKNSYPAFLLCMRFCPDSLVIKIFGSLVTLFISEYLSSRSEFVHPTFSICDSLHSAFVKAYSMVSHYFVIFHNYFSFFFIKYTFYKQLLHYSSLIPFYYISYVLFLFFCVMCLKVLIKFSHSCKPSELYIHDSKHPVYSSFLRYIINSIFKYIIIRWKHFLKKNSIHDLILLGWFSHWESPVIFLSANYYFSFIFSLNILVRIRK